MDNDYINIGSQIADETIDITHEEIASKINQELIYNSNLFLTIRKKIESFLEKVEFYEKDNTNNLGSISQQIARLKAKKEFIYADFFEIQNLINAFLGQRIIMTYVHVDDEGKREIRIADNDIMHLTISQGTNWGGNPFYKLSYVVDNHYQVLKNSLPEKDNNTLNNTAMEIERRYIEYKKRILWYYPNYWKGYKMSNRGPINEAFVNFYIHNIQLNNSMEKNIDIFMLDNEYGAINADATKGYLIGDVTKDGVQYAVKGLFGSPQGTKDIIKAFQKLLKEDFSEDAFKQFINKYTIEEMNKNYKPQIKELSTRSINSYINYHKEKIFKDIKINISV